MKNLYKIEDELYVVSNNEGISENCWIITSGRLVQVSYLLSNEVVNGFKVILTTNDLLIKDSVQAIDDEFLEWFVNNPNCEEVEIKTRYLHYYKTGEKLISFTKTPEFSSRNMQCIKIEPRYEIIIPQEEPKQMSKPTALDLYEKEINSLIEKYEAKEISKREFITMKHNLFYNAKEMEEKQIINAFKEGNLYHGWALKHEPEKYYNETYKNENK
jgi:hypothetical protein